MIYSFAEKLSNNDKRLFKGIDDTGRAAWWLVKLSKVKAPIFEHNKQNGKVDFSEFGEIIDSGYGEAPLDLLGS